MRNLDVRECGWRKKSQRSWTSHAKITLISTFRIKGDEAEDRSLRDLDSDGRRDAV